MYDFKKNVSIFKKNVLKWKYNSENIVLLPF